MRDTFLHQIKNAPEVNVQHLVPLIKGCVLDIAVLDDTGGVYENVYFFEMLQGLGYQPVNLREFRHVGKVYSDTPFTLSDLVAELAQFMLVAADGDNAGAIHGKQSCRRAP